MFRVRRWQCTTSSTPAQFPASPIGSGGCGSAGRERRRRFGRARPRTTKGGRTATTTVRVHGAGTGRGRRGGWGREARRRPGRQRCGRTEGSVFLSRRAGFLEVAWSPGELAHCRRSGHVGQLVLEGGYEGGDRRPAADAKRSSAGLATPEPEG